MNYIIKKSEISDNAGLGVFANKNFKKNTKLGEYKGKEIFINSWSQADKYNQLKDKINDTSYIFLIFDGKKPYKIIDAGNSIDSNLTNWTRYINGAKTVKQKKKINAEFYQYDKRAFIKSIKDIQKGDEIILNYGPGWKWNN